MAKAKQETTDYKTKLEKKLVLARESPEAVFDLSDCNLKTLPNDIFSLIKVLRKEALNLQKNNLTDLQSGGKLADLKNLIILDISSNNFSKLPLDLGLFGKLQILNVSKNQLTEIPQEVGQLSKLVILNASNNKLRSVADTIGNCQHLEVLDFSNNETLKSLPKTLGKLENLLVLRVDSALAYPPSEICKSGITDMMQFFRKELSELEIRSKSTKKEPLASEFSRFEKLEELSKEQEDLKQKKKKELLKFEQSLADMKAEEAKLQSQSKKQQAKVLENIKANEKAMNEELQRLQALKNEERSSLMKAFQDEEEKSRIAINKILKANKFSKLQETALWEAEWKEQEQKLMSKAKVDRSTAQKEALEKMENLMKAEVLKAHKAMAEKRNTVLNSVMSQNVFQNKELENWLKKRDEETAQLVSGIHRDETLQKMAVTSLLEKSDTASWQLAKEISIVQAQLAELTQLELKKKKVRTESYLAELNKNRQSLMNVLVALFEKQEKRRKVLIEMMTKMEQMKNSLKDSDTFWMEQYQKLYQSKCHELVKFLESVDQKLVYELFLNNVFQYLPLLKDIVADEKELENLNVNTLKKTPLYEKLQNLHFQLGIADGNDRNGIMDAVNTYLAQQKSQNTEPSSSSAKEPPDLLPSPSFIASEDCVICLEGKPEVVFVPCGHICSCLKCYEAIESCPLCRKPIDKIFDLIRLA